MARQARKKSATGIYHIMMRGVNIFKKTQRGIPSINQTDREIDWY